MQWNAVNVARVFSCVQSDVGILPIGKASALDPLRTATVPPTPALVNQVLAVSFAATEKQVPFVNVAGFVHVYVPTGHIVCSSSCIGACHPCPAVVCAGLP